MLACSLWMHRWVAYVESGRSDVAIFEPYRHFAGMVSAVDALQRGAFRRRGSILHAAVLVVRGPRWCSVWDTLPKINVHGSLVLV